MTSLRAWIEDATRESEGHPLPRCNNKDCSLCEDAEAARQFEKLVEHLTWWAQNGDNISRNPGYYGPGEVHAHTVATRTALKAAEGGKS